MDTRGADVLVIGGGIVGLATAFELTLAGARVLVLERGRLGREASWAGAGILFPLMPWDYAEPVNRLALAGAALYPDWTAALEAETGIDPGYRVSGMRVFAPFDARTARVWAGARGVPVVEESGPAGGGSLWLPGVAQVRNPRLLKALAAWVAGRGVRAVEGAAVERFDVGGDQLRAVETLRGRFSADAYVICAGAWGGGLSERLGAPLPIRPVRGQMLLLRAPAGLPLEILYGEGTYVVPRGDGRVLVGATLEHGGFDKTTDAAALDGLWRRALRMAPELGGASREAHWCGLRPGSPGNLPVIDRHPRLDNVYLNGGHFRYGLTMAPASARLLLKRMRGGPIEGTRAYAWPEPA